MVKNNRTLLENKELAHLSNTSLRNLLVAGFVKTDETISLAGYRQSLPALAAYVKLNSAFIANNPLDCYVIDSLDKNYRFTVIYTVQSTILNNTLQIITKTNSSLPLISLQALYPAFNWAEREVWDMSGIFFIKHPDLRRILTDYGFPGHPLRKDFPLSGFKEVQYTDITKHVEYTNVELSQNYRVFTVSNSWSNEKAQ